MNTIIAGSRTITDPSTVVQAITASGWNITRVLSGLAKGVDKLGMDWADRNGIPVDEYPAHWELEGKRAGYLRNERMAESADALIAIWDGRSKGTGHMIDIARREGLRVFVWEDSE